MRIAHILVAASALSSTVRAEAPAKEKVFIPPVKGEKISEDVLSAMFDLVVIAVDRAKVMRVVTLDDVNSMLDQEKRKEAVGCSSISCAVEVGGALGVRYLLTTRAKKLGGQLVFTASLIDTAQQESKNGQGRCSDQESEYGGAVQSAVAEAFGLEAMALAGPAHPNATPVRGDSPGPAVDSAAARSWLGVKVQPLTLEVARSCGLATAGGALVSEVFQNGPASAAGVKPGDVILKLDGKPLQNEKELVSDVGAAAAGTRVELTYWRDKAEYRVTVVLAPRPDAGAARGATDRPPGRPSLGMTVDDITPTLQAEMKLEASKGVVIKAVAAGSAAEKAGAQPGDIILESNGAGVGRAADFATAVRKLESGSVIRIQILRKGTRLLLGMSKP